MTLSGLDPISSWVKAVDSPLRLAALALGLIFVITVQSVRKAPALSARARTWVLAGAFILFPGCLCACLYLDYAQDRGRATVNGPQPTASPAPTAGGASPQMRVGDIQQKVNQGAAVAGVQGAVTINDTGPSEKK
jgi:hypothetical protein